MQSLRLPKLIRLSLRRPRASCRRFRLPRRKHANCDPRKTHFVCYLLLSIKTGVTRRFKPMVATNFTLL